MDSISNLKAENSHQSEVVVGNHNINKNSSAQQSNQKINQSDPRDTNFEYEDNEWDIGIGDLIIDLDADIEKSSKIESSFISPLDPAVTNNKKTAAASKNIKEGIESEKGVLKKNLKVKSDSIKMSSVNNSNANKNLSKMSIDHQATLDKGLKMKIKRTKTGKTSESKHEIVKAESNGNLNVDDQNCEKTSNLGVSASPSSSSGKRTSSNHKKDKIKEKTHSKDKQDSSSSQEIIIADPISCTKSSVDLHNRLNNATGIINDKQATGVVSGSLKNTVMIKQKESMKPQINSSTSSTGASTMYQNISESKEDNKGTISPPIKRAKCDPKGMVDVCVGTSIGTITEPDCLGPCEPGTSVTLEGIVWHETEGGVLAVNVTWRGKTYVGTLIDCTKHDWAPPRFCDSPTEDLESRMQKSGRSKRARNSTTSNNELLNFTETRSSVHSKLRNGGSKGRTSRNSSIGAPPTNITPSTSPTAFLVPKSDKRRKSKDESPSSSNGNSSGSNVTNSTLNAATCNTPNLKKPKNTTSPCAVSPVLIECPEQDCSKKYKHANGLKYHQSHAHGTITSTEEETLQPPDSPFQYSSSSTSNEKTPVVEATDSPTIINNKTNPLETPPPHPEKPLSIKSVLQLNEGATINPPKPFVTSPIKEEISKTPTVEEEPAVVDATIKPAPSSENLDKSNKNASQFGVNPDFEQISNDSIGDTSMQANNLNFFQINPQSKVPSAKKQKNRKSPGPETLEDHSLNRSENVRSPAYSDISDDSNAPIDNHMIDKSKPTPLQKITPDQQTNSLIMGGYNNLSFYPSPTFLQNPDNQNNKSISNVINYGEYGKPREQHNPLDLIGKLHIGKNNQETANSNTAPPPPPQKVMHQHFPYNLMQGNYPQHYNMEASFGMQNVGGEEGKNLSGPIKEEHPKETMYNAESLRHGMQPKPTKLESGKEIKAEPPSPMEQQPPPHQHPSFYSNLYSRHPMNLPSSREEDIHRRLNSSATSISSIKEEQQQHMQQLQQSLPSHSASQPMNFQTSPQQMQKPNQKSLSSKSNMSREKEMKHEQEKESFKVKNEGQKPTMETQGPPPPPTNQYYLPYIGPGGSPFFPDPSHSIYRNMLVPPYNTPYHIPMARFPTPEDLSRNTKALDLLQQHASQYYNTHKIHELNDRVNHLKSPTSSNAKMPPSVIPSPNLSSNNPMAGNSSLPSSNSNNSINVNNVNINEKSNNNDDNISENDKDMINRQNGPINRSPHVESADDDGDDTNENHDQQNDSKNNDNDRTNSSPSNHSIPNPNNMSQMNASKLSNERNDRIDASNNLSRTNSSPSTQRHVHTHHHTHVGVYPMYPAPYVNR
ncbi:hypothetical protein ACKWTF_004864 [Chironomus riparius]